MAASAARDFTGTAMVAMAMVMATAAASARSAEMR
jgi:hypothetical protein